MTRNRPCLVCREPCRSEGQLCPGCVADGAWVTDDTVNIEIGINIPTSLLRGA